MIGTLKKILSFTLVCILLVGSVPVTAAADTPILYYSAGGGNIIRASFASNDITVDGYTSELGWDLSTAVSANAKVAAQWDQSSLYIAIENPDSEAMSVTLNGVALTAENAVITANTSNTCVEYAVSLETLGMLVTNYNDTLSASITVGSDTWDGTIVLTSVEWVATKNAGLPTVSRSRYQLALVDLAAVPTDNQNVLETSDGLHFFDLYDEGGNNPRQVRSSGSYDIADLIDRSVSTALEFTFHADEMAVYELGSDNEFWSYIPTAGFGYWITDGSTEYSNPNMVTMGIINTDVGLVFVAHNDARDYTFVLNKYVGDTFRVTTIWNPDNSVNILIDGVEIGTYQDMTFHSLHQNVDANRLYFYLQRSVDSAESAADNFDLYVTDIAFGKSYGNCVTDSLTFDTIKGDNASASEITSDLRLPASHTTPQIDTAANITWESSDPAVIDPVSGKVTRPAENGKSVTLTAVVDELALRKEFNVFVKGLNPSSDILYKTKDTATTKGAGQVFDGDIFTLDATNNSLIRDLGETKTVNVIALKDGDTITRLNESMLSIWVSDDNAFYRETDSFKILRDGQYTYLYDFTATARYIKVHCTTHDTTASDFIGPVDGMMEVYYSNVFGDGGNAFATQSEVTIANTGDKIAYDRVYVISPAEAGVSSVTADMSDVRFYLGEELLYHYFDGANFFVRVTEIAANSTATLKVLSGNANALNISDKEYVYEVVYGTRETEASASTRWIESLPDGGVVCFRANAFSDQPIYYTVSYDEGRSWSDSVVTIGTEDYLCVPYGDYYDWETGRTLLYGTFRTDWENTTDEYRIMYSDDLMRFHPAPITYLNEELPKNLMTYGDFIRVSSYDGEDGPNVDYVIAVAGSDLTHAEYNGDYPKAAGTVLYSVDAGKSWVTSTSTIRYSKGEGYHKRETGITEPTIMEDDNGVLIYYARCQYDNVDHFAVSYSYDFGVTWTEEATLSNIYTTNTQPIMFTFDDANMIVWGGNNALGGSSYRRYPLNVAVTYDGARTFEGIHDLYCRTAFQGMIMGNRFDTTNPTGTQIGDAFISYFTGDGSYQIRVDNFADYFYLTKGAYDSFENATPEFEGWAVTGGMIENDATKSTDGTQSMRFSVGSSAVRSIPSLSNGTISFDLWIEDAASADFSVALQSSFTFDSHIAAPVAFDIENGALTFLGDSYAITPDLKNGWNHFELTLALDASVQSATLSINDSAAIKAPIVDGIINNYVCYVNINMDGPQTYNLDAFLVVDEDEINYIRKQTMAVERVLSEVPTALQATYTDVDALNSTLTKLMTDTHGAEYAQNSKIMDVNLLVSTDGSESWDDATLLDIPMRGIEIRLDYPEGTSADTHDFKLIHMFSEDSARHNVTAGDWESPVITEREDGLYVTMLGFSPVILSWSDGSEAPADTAPTANVMPTVLWIGAATLVLLAGAIIIAKKKKSVQTH